MPSVTILGTRANQPIDDLTPINPFAAVVVSTAAASAYATASVTLSNPANGALSNLGVGSLNPIGAAYTISGTAAEIQAALRALVFTPTIHEVMPGAVVTTGLVLTIGGSAGSATDATTSVLATATETAPVIADSSFQAITPTPGMIQPFISTTITDPDAGATEASTIRLTQNGVLSDAAGTLSGFRLQKIGVGTYTLSQASIVGENSALEALVFTPTSRYAAASVNVTLAVSDGIAPPTTATSTLNVEANPGGNTITTSTTDTLTTYDDTPTTNATHDYATTIEAELNGSTILYDQTFNLPYADPAVQAAVAQARAALANAGAANAPVAQTSSNLVTLSSQTTAVQTGSSTVFTNFASYPSGPAVEGPGVSGPLAAPNTAGYIVLPAGQLDMNIDNSYVTTVTRNVTTTSTDLLSQQYVLSGVSTAPVIIAGTVAGQATADTAALAPFSTVTIVAASPNAYATATVTLSAANGVLSDLGVGTLGAGGVYTVKGTAADIQAALRAVRFTPTRYETSIGNTVATGFSLTVVDSAGSAADATTTVLATAADTPPTITDTTTPLPSADNAVGGTNYVAQRSVPTPNIQPFAYTVIGDPDPGAIESSSITLTQNGAASDAAGTLSGTGLTKTGVGTYTLAAGSVAAENTALQALVFTQTTLGAPISIGVALAVSDGFAAPVSATFPLNVTGSPAASYEVTASDYVTTVYKDALFNGTAHDYATTIESVLNGSTVLYEQTFNLPYSDPIVQNALAQARAAFAGSTAAAGSAMQTASNLTVLDSQTRTILGDTTFAPFIVTSTDQFGPVYYGPGTSLAGAVPAHSY